MCLSIEERFGNELRATLTHRYGRVPSAAFVANRFNQLTTARNGVSGESARRWIRGVSIPRHVHLAVLLNWLGLDFQGIFDGELRSKTERTTPSFVTQFSALGPEVQERLLALVDSSFGIVASQGYAVKLRSA